MNFSFLVIYIPQTIFKTLYFYYWIDIANGYNIFRNLPIFKFFLHFK